LSLNWKEINLILEELDLPGSQIQSVIQSAYDVIGLRLHKSGQTKHLLIAITPGACRIHETFKPFPKTDKPLRFAQFFKSKVVNGRIEEAVQLGDNRIIRLTVNGSENRFRLYIRLWSNAANFIVTDENGNVLDAMRRLPKKGEVTGGCYKPEDLISNSSHRGTGNTENTEEDKEKRKGKKEKRNSSFLNPSATSAPLRLRENSSPVKREYFIRELPGEGSFNRKIDVYYTENGGALSLEALREQARRVCESSITKLTAALENLQAKAAEYSSADRLREYGDIILANAAAVKPGDEWLETEDFFSGGTSTIRIKLEPRKSPAAQAENYYEQYRKAKNGLAGIQEEIETGKYELKAVEERLEFLLAQDNPLVLAKLLKSGSRLTGKHPSSTTATQDAKRPGLTFRRGEWLIMVGRNATENDTLLRRHVKGNDMWLHVRDFPGSYVFIKNRAGKSFPLEILLDAGNLALFYSKGRNNGEGDLFYTQVKYLRRAKNGPKGLVIPTQEKNLHIKLDEKRLRELKGSG